VFYNFTKNISFDFISFDWVFFTFSGFLLSIGFFYPRILKLLNFEESKLKLTIHENNLKPNALLGRDIKVSSEYLSAIVLFVMLNLLLLTVNVLDANYLYFGGSLPAGVSYSEAVHDGVGALIFSIIVAIAIILIHLRGHLNFYSKNKTLKYAAYIWVLQNVLLIISTIYRNALYIHESGLTYKRIGVYVYLLLAVIGLITTLIKIAQNRTSWYLITNNVWAAYMVLIVSTFCNWDLFITNYNLSKPEADIEYLFSLSDNNLVALENIVEKLMNDGKVTDQDKSYRDKFEKRKQLYIRTYSYSDWQSLTYNKYATIKAFNTHLIAVK
jgi:hypothetical protein